MNEYVFFSKIQLFYFFSRKFCVTINTSNLIFEVIDERNLQRDLHDSNRAAHDVELVGKVFHVVVERAGDDGEDHVQEGEDGGEAKQSHVQVHLGVHVIPVRMTEVQLLHLCNPNHQGNDANRIDDGMCNLRHIFGLSLQVYIKT